MVFYVIALSYIIQSAEKHLLRQETLYTRNWKANHHTESTETGG